MDPVRVLRGLKAQVIYSAETQSVKMTVTPACDAQSTMLSTITNLL